MRSRHPPSFEGIKARGGNGGLEPFLVSLSGGRGGRLAAAERRDAASSVARIALLFGLPASLPRLLRRAPATSPRPPDSRRGGTARGPWRLQISSGRDRRTPKKTVDGRNSRRRRWGGVEPSVRSPALAPTSSRWRRSM